MFLKPYLIQYGKFLLKKKVACLISIHLFTSFHILPVNILWKESSTFVASKADVSINDNPLSAKNQIILDYTV